MENAEVMTKYDGILEQYVYEKIWSELSGRDQEILRTMVSTSDTQVEKIRKILQMHSENLSVYRKQFMKRSLIQQTKYNSKTRLFARQD